MWSHLEGSNREAAGDPLPSSLTRLSAGCGFSTLVVDWGLRFIAGGYPGCLSQLFAMGQLTAEQVDSPRASDPREP